MSQAVDCRRGTLRQKDAHNGVVLLGALSHHVFASVLTQGELVGRAVMIGWTQKNVLTCRCQSCPNHIQTGKLRVVPPLPQMPQYGLSRRSSAVDPT